MRIVYVSIQSTDANVFRNPVEEVCKENGWDLDLYCANDVDIDEDPLTYHELVNRSKDADLVLVRVMADPNRMKRFEKWSATFQDCSGYVYVHSGNLDVTLAYRDVFKGDDVQFMRLRSYMSLRGRENDRAIVMWLHNLLTGEGNVPEPMEQRRDGIYHPDFPRDVELEDYLKSLNPDMPTAAILFTGNLWIYGNLEHIDALIREAESRGMNTIPVFFSAPLVNNADESGTIRIVRNYLMDGDKCRADVIIMASPFSQLNNSRDCAGIRTPDEQNFFSFLSDVPVLQAMSQANHFADFEESAVGLTKGELTMSVIWPEIDGQIITVPIASNEQGKGAPKRYSPLQDRISHLVTSALGWANLRRKPRSEKKVAILIYQARPDTGRIGSAAGLDTIESVARMLSELDSAGYTLDHVPDTKGFLDELLHNVTNDLEWTSESDVRDKAIDMVPVDRYRPAYDSIPEFNRRMMEDAWGEPPGNLMVQDRKMIIPGIINGNVYVGYQPMRSMPDQYEDKYHDPLHPPSHQYLEFYRWLKNDFKADVVMHIGTHGTLEWLPGRSVGLSGKCFPDIVLDGVPHIYPYVIDDPGEGIQCKRRSEAVLIGHMCPTMSRAGTYDDLETVNSSLQEYFKNRAAKGEQKKAMVIEILEASRAINLLQELGIPEDITPDDFEQHLGDIHDYISDVKDALVRNGLHIMGDVPEGELLMENVYSLTRVRNGDIPSLRASIAESMGFELDTLMGDPTGEIDGRLKSVILDDVDNVAMDFISVLHSKDYSPMECLEVASNYGDDVVKVTELICNSIVPNLRRMSDEIGNIIHACDGGYVLPGPSGAPTRGCADILPMGRNFYGIDPDIIPTKASWEIGRKMADQMIERYIDSMGAYPTEVGFIIWATDTMKNNGDDVAYILWLLGVRPVWASSGNQVIGLEPVPLEELGRPRIDVTVRITGLFRDAFPNLIDLIDDAVKIVSNLDESDEDNILAANLRRDIAESIASGVSVDEARRRAAVRIFGCPPGAYGPGINHAIESSEWKTVQDLADIYLDWGSYAYGHGVSGESMRDEFIRRFSNVKATVKNMPDREIDLLDIDDVYGYLGGMNSFVKAYGNREAMSFIGDSSDPDKVKTRGAKEELQFVYRSKILNPKFINGLKRHGFRGVSEVEKLTEYTFGWDATSDIVDDWVYESLAETYLLNEENREWMMDENPYAMMSMMDRLFEAIHRGMWDAKPETLERLKEIYIDLEGRMEDLQD